MVIHLPNERLARLGINMDENIVSHRVIDSLHLQTDVYTGEAIWLAPLATNSKPERKVTFEWNVAGKPTKYTTTFAVLDEVLGRNTIKKIGFYKKSCEIW